MIFTDAGSDNPYINIDTAVSPASVVVSNTESYDFAGSGAITTGKLTKLGPGWLSLENNNTYSGPTVISNGVVQVGGNNEGGSTGSLGTGAVTNNGSLV
ncbi:MAG: autotransporter-associated beta strand repeat-containing protein, partial [Syntrophobacteraceae bacterium]